MLNPLAISVLALLNERPMHPYEMYLLLLERQQDRIVKVRPGSLYHTVERLADEELVRATGTARAGNRPERTTYTITATGRDALVDRVGELIRVPVNEYPAFVVALAESHNVDRRAVLGLLAERIDHLQDLVAGTEKLHAQVNERAVPEAYTLVVGYLRTMHDTERRWLGALAERIENEDLPWPKA